MASEHLPQHDRQHLPFSSQQEREWNRRDFLKWLSAGISLAGIGLPACRRIDKYLVAHNNAPEWTVPGVETSYATCCTIQGQTQVLLATCSEGRPIKLVPSLQYPGTSGLNSIAQAGILDLYNPERSRQVLFQGKPTDNVELHGAFASWAHHIKTHGKTAVLVSRTNSPLIASMLSELQQKSPGLRLYYYTATPPPNSAMQSALPATHRFQVNFSQAKRIVALDCDFLMYTDWGNTRDFVAARSPYGLHYQDSDNAMSRLYAVESRVSVTGAYADHRLAISPDKMQACVWELLRLLTPDNEQTSADNNHLSPQESAWLHACARDLQDHPAESVILLGEQYKHVAPLVWQLNKRLHAIGTCIRVMECPPPSNYDILEHLLVHIEQQSIDTVFLAEPDNPVKTAACGHRLAQALRAVESVHLGLYVDETAQACRWHLPATHFLESWGIEQDNRGRLCYRQPVVLPLFNGISTEEVLSGLLSTKGLLSTADNAPNHLSPVYHRARKFFDRTVPAENKEAAWTQALQRGYSQETQYPVVPLQEFTCKSYQSAPILVERATNQLFIQWVSAYTVYNEMAQHNAWLQECPDPITGVSWGPSAQIAPETMAKLNGGDICPMLCELNIHEQSWRFILCPIPGVAPDVLILPAGYDNPYDEQQNADSINAYSLLGQLQVINTDQLRLTPLPSQYVALHSPNTQGHALAAEYAAQVPLPPTTDTGTQWNMLIDTSRCIGCNACIIACRAENNIPVVGREQMARGRELNWLRIDKYFNNRGAMTAVPIACQQCGKAPCESVCPVNATVHTTDGLNAMVYARCWGTRYCAGNCPYKARRFNFFDYAKTSAAITNRQTNPNVTVRSRGVMEKCTYCVQLLERAKIRHKAALMQQERNGDSTKLHVTAAELRLPDGAVQTACQLACPMHAISFGNILDKNSQVRRAKSLPQYRVLLPQNGTEPATGYLAPVKNYNSHII